jgi:hypothetical protein
MAEVLKVEDEHTEEREQQAIPAEVNEVGRSHGVLARVENGVCGGWGKQRRGGVRSYGAIPAACASGRVARVLGGEEVNGEGRDVMALVSLFCCSAASGRSGDKISVDERKATCELGCWTARF